MKTIWNFSLDNRPEFPLKSNAFSSVSGTKRTAEHWANYLLHWNKDSRLVTFMRENGRKIYEMRRINTV